ncbi:MAG: hypothetical protein RIR86_2061 [Acidobacteriota bacterium]
MLINHYSTVDTKGGAALAALRLHRALREAGAASTLYVREKLGQEAGVERVPPLQENRFLHRLRRLTRGHRPVPTYTFNLDERPRISIDRFLATHAEGAPTVSVIHWVDDFLDIASIRRLIDHFRGPLVWMIHDLEPLTGGCHYSFGCQKYLTECGACPQLGSADPHDRANRNWRRRRDLLADQKICFIAPTSWGEARIRESSLFGQARIARIPLPIDSRIFRPYARQVARDLLHLPAAAPVLLCGASYVDDPRKGMRELVRALHLLSPEKCGDLHILLVGLNGECWSQELPWPVHYLGEVFDPLLMALAYQSADIFLCPSLADSGPMMIPESLLCGTPVVAFPTGGAPDWIEHGVNGYLARFGDAADFAAGIELLLTLDREIVARSARSSVEDLHRPDLIARQHLQLYRELLNSDAEHD